MKSPFFRGRMRISVALLLIGGLLLLASCVPSAEDPILSPRLGAVLAQIEADGEIKIEPTAVPLRLVDLPAEQVNAGLPADFATALAAANPANATTISLANGCVGCHNMDPSVVATGPTWYNVADTAANRRPGESPALYLYTSIVDPSAYVVPNYPDNIMLKTFGETLSQQELADLVAYLLAQHTP